MQSIPQPSIPRWRQTWLLGSDPLRLLASSRAECGDFFLLRPYGVGPWAFASSPEILTELFSQGEELVVAGEARHRQFGYLIGDNFSLALDGREYLKRRRFLYPLLNGKHIFELNDELVAIVDEAIGSWPVDEAFSALRYTDQISRYAIERVLLGTEIADDLDELCKEFLDSLKSPRVMIRLFQVDLGPRSPWGRYQRARTALHARLHREILRLVEQPGDRDDALSGLIEHLGGDGPEQRETIVQEVMGFLVGGAETTSKMMLWMLHDVLTTEGLVEELREEQERVVGDDTIGPEHFRELPCLHAIVEEALRYRAPGPFAAPRLVKKDIELGGFHVPAGTLISQAVSESGRNRHFAAPDRYAPQLHFGGGKVPESHYHPFGGGIRKCTGLGLARVELTLFAARALRRYDFELLSSDEPEADGIGYIPEKGLMLRATPRRVSVAVGSADPAAASDGAENAA